MLQEINRKAVLYRKAVCFDWQGFLLSELVWVVQKLYSYYRSVIKHILFHNTNDGIFYVCFIFIECFYVPGVCNTQDINLFFIFEVC